MAMMHLALLVTLLAAAVVSEDPNSRCGNDDSDQLYFKYNQENGFCFTEPTDYYGSFNVARKKCESHGAHLPRPKSRAEMDAINAIAASFAEFDSEYDAYWLDGVLMVGDNIWWSDGSGMKWSNWASGNRQPHSAFACVYTKHGVWRMESECNRYDPGYYAICIKDPLKADGVNTEVVTQIKREEEALIQVLLKRLVKGN